MLSATTFCIVLSFTHSIGPARDALGNQYQYSGSYAADQRRLIRRLTDPYSYDPRARPVVESNQPINVTIRMNLYQIVEIHERQQYVELYCWMTQMWHDSSLAWNPVANGNITMIVLPYTEIWLPDTYLYNNLAMVREDSEHWINVILQMEGHISSALVTFRYPALYKFTCNMDVKYFPFDKQHCTMVFGSWTYDATGIDFLPEKEDIAKEDFSESEEWTLLSFKAYRVLEKYACCPEPFSLLRLHLSIKRKPLHYIINLIIPSVIISLISNIGFFTPSTTGTERTEKVHLGITTLLAFAILLLMVSDQMPTTSASVPLIGWFLLGIMIQTSVATLVTAVIMASQRRSLTGKRLSGKTRRFFFNKLAPILQVAPPPLLVAQLIFGSPPSLSTCCSMEELGIAREAEAAVEDFSSPGYHGTTKRYSTASVRFPATPKNSLTENGRWQLKTHLKPTESRNTVMSAQSQTEMTRQQMISAEYEWFSAILDRISLIVSLGSVLALALGISVIGYVQAAV